MYIIVVGRGTIHSQSILAHILLYNTHLSLFEYTFNIIYIIIHHNYINNNHFSF